VTRYVTITSHSPPTTRGVNPYRETVLHDTRAIELSLGRSFLAGVRGLGKGTALESHSRSPVEAFQSCWKNFSTALGGGQRISGLRFRFRVSGDSSRTQWGEYSGCKCFSPLIFSHAAMVGLSHLKLNANDCAVLVRKWLKTPEVVDDQYSESPTMDFALEL
jgi:hypothetical protein